MRQMTQMTRSTQVDAPTSLRLGMRQALKKICTIGSTTRVNAEPGVLERKRAIARVFEGLVHLALRVNSVARWPV